MLPGYNKVPALVAGTFFIRYINVISMEAHKQKEYIAFACAGCSHAGQVAYKLGLALDEKGLAEMSCLAGVAAQKPSFLRKIRNKKIMVIDGCPIECAKGIFDQQGITVDAHVRLKELGVKKNQPREEDKDMDGLIAKLGLD